MNPSPTVVPKTMQTVFALTMGDPAGIGPEIALKELQDPSSAHDTLIIGDLGILRATAAALKISPEFNTVTTIDTFFPGKTNVLDCSELQPGSFTLGKPQAACGKAAFKYITKAIELAMSGTVGGVVTNPINKESLKMAGIHYPGHTEIFADKTGTSHYSMLFFLRNVGVAHVTTHCSLRDAIALITIERVVEHITLLNNALHQLGVRSPRIAVGGLNPHAGENGQFGTEEIEHISPAVQIAHTAGITVSGPYPPDTVFMRAFRGEFDGIVAMLHDHGFVALKSMDFEHGVNITIGLPIIRTSVGHGTAFDIVGSGAASTASLHAAINAARQLYYNRSEEECT